MIQVPEAKTFSIILPTRKRPGNLARLLNSIIETAAVPGNIEICARVDIDDIETIGTLTAFADRLGGIKTYVGTRRMCHGDYWNEAWQVATGDVLQMSSDDFVYRTKDWDIEILKEINKFDDKIVFVYGEDGIQHGALGTHFFVHKNWANALGEFVQMHTKVYYHDTWNDVLATRVDRRMYRPDLLFEHLHWTRVAGGVDDNVNESWQKSGEDAVIWERNWQGEAMQRDEDKLRAVMNNG